MNVYKVRIGGVHKNGKGANDATYVISLPRDLGERLKGRKFFFTLTPEGLLYRPIEEVDEPEWMNDA